MLTSATHPKRKLSVYLDETGQDTQGHFFLVALVVVEEEREQMRSLLHTLEQASHKGRQKWSKLTRKKKLAYVTTLLAHPLSCALYVVTFHHTRAYLESTGAALAQVIARYAGQVPTEVFVFIDGLPKSLQHQISRYIKIPQIAVKRIRGLTDDEDEFIRLADSLCGIAREAQEGDEVYQRALATLVQRGGVQLLGAEQ
jgi:hypothetical protein